MGRLTTTVFVLSIVLSQKSSVSFKSTVHLLINDSGIVHIYIQETGSCGLGKDEGYPTFFT